MYIGVIASMILATKILCELKHEASCLAIDLIGFTHSFALAGGAIELASPCMRDLSAGALHFHKDGLGSP